MATPPVWFLKSVIELAKSSDRDDLVQKAETLLQRRKKENRVKMRKSYEKRKLDFMAMNSPMDEDDYK